MIDCAKEVRAYHNEDVTLPKTEQDEMRDRRNANRTRLRSGLAKAGKPAPPRVRQAGELRHENDDSGPGQRLRYR